MLSKRLSMVGLVIGLGLVAYLGWNRLGPRSDPDQLAREVASALASGQLDQARGAIDALTRLRSPTPEDWILRAELARAAGQEDEAIESLKHVPSGHPGEVAARLTIGLIQLKRDHVRDAKATLSRIHSQSSLLSSASEAALWAQATRALLRIALFESDWPAVNKLLGALSDSDATALSFDEAYLWTIRRPRDVGAGEIAGTLERWMRVDPGDEITRLALAEALRGLGRINDAASILQESAQKESPAWKLVSARIALDDGEPGRARQLVGSLVENQGMRESQFERLALLGRIELTQGNVSTAVVRLRAALALMPDDREVQFGLAQALKLSGQSDEAQVLIAKVAERDQLEHRIKQAQVPSERENATALAAIAKACETLGARGQARAWYRLALVKQPTNSVWQAAVQRLRATSNSQAPNAPGSNRKN